MKNEIKVIKKVDRERESDRTPANSKRRKREPTRDAINTITGWVRDIQGRRRVDPKRAFDSLFNDPLIGVTES